MLIRLSPKVLQGVLLKMLKKTLSLLVAMAAISSASLVQAGTDDDLDASIQASSPSVQPLAPGGGGGPPPCATANGAGCEPV